MQCFNASGLMLIQCAPKHVFALHETCVVAISKTACCATVVAHVIFRLHPFVLAQGFGSSNSFEEVCVLLMPRRKQNGDRMFLLFHKISTNTMRVVAR
jgi:hypothetical protein